MTSLLAGLLPAPSVQSLFRFMLPPLPDLPPGAETPVPSEKTFQLSQQYCSFCQRTGLHSVLEKVDPREHTSPGAVSWLLQCKGCGAFSLQ
jgi:hypothetical protein